MRTSKLIAPLATLAVSVACLGAPPQAPAKAPRITLARLERFLRCDPAVARLELDRLQKNLDAINSRKPSKKLAALDKKLKRKVDRAARACGFRSDAELKAFRLRVEQGRQLLKARDPSAAPQPEPPLAPEEQSVLRAAWPRLIQN